MRINTLFVAAVTTSLLILPIQAALAPPELDAVVERVRTEFDVPGIAIAIVKDNENVVVKGYGVRTMDEPALVDAETAFNIASISKGFTAVALAVLVDEGKLRWDDTVIKHLPDFQLSDPWVTREITVRDILSHRSGLGLGAGDLLRFPDNTFTSDEIIFRLRFIKPASSFRSTYAYNNCLYIVAGKVLQVASGKTWDEFIRERIFSRLGMKHSSISKEDLLTITNKARSHVVTEGHLQMVGYMNGANDVPAAGINSCAADMARWTMMLLDRGTNRDAAGNRTRIVSPAQLHELWSAQTPLPTGADDPPPEFAALKSNFSAYGLGFELSDMFGRKVVTHGGTKPGQTSRLTLVPDMRLGIVILSNKDSDEAVGSLTLHILSHYLGGPRTDWVGSFVKNAKENQLQTVKSSANQVKNRKKGTKLSLPLEQYAGDYVDAWYGDVSVKLEDGRLVLRFSRTLRMVGDLEHWHYDTFVARWRERTLNGDAFVFFALTPKGEIERMKMAPFLPQTDFSFDYKDLDFKPAPKAKAR